MKKIVIKVSSLDKFMFNSYIAALQKAEAKSEADMYFRLARKIIQSGRRV